MLIRLRNAIKSRNDGNEILDLKRLIRRVFQFKFVKFGFVGAMGFVIDMAITWTLKEKVGIDLYVANGIGFVVAVTNNFYINKYWTFQDRDTRSGYQLGVFFAVALLGLVWNTLLLKFFFNSVGLSFYTSKIIAILIVSIWNFMVNKWITFRSAP